VTLGSIATPEATATSLGPCGLRALVRGVARLPAYAALATALGGPGLGAAAVDAVVAEIDARERGRPSAHAALLGPLADRVLRCLNEAGVARGKPHRIALRPRLLDAVATALRVRAGGAEADVRRLFASPFSGCDRVDVQLVLRLAAREPGVCTTIDRGRLVVPPQRAQALHRFTRAIAALRADAPRDAVGSVRAVRGALDLDCGLDGAERATLEALGGAASDLDLAAGLLARLGATDGPSAAAFDAPAALALAVDELAAASASRADEDPPLVPLPHREPEPAVRVPRRAMTFSASALAAYAECERKWYFRYVCGAVDDPGTSASFYGSAFHDALEHFHATHVRPDAASAETLAQDLRTRLDAAFDRYRGRFATPVEFELQLRRARRTATRYVEWFVRRGRTRPFTVVGTETQERIELGGFPFVGYVDRLDRDDVSADVTVVDYKTGNVATSAAEYRAKVAAFVDFQLPFYYWARTALGDRVARLALVPLKDATLAVAPVELEIVPVALPAGRDASPIGAIGVDELERARDRMIAIAQELTRGEQTHFPATDDPTACGYCAYKDACRERPSVAEDPFGR